MLRQLSWKKSFFYFYIIFDIIYHYIIKDITFICHINAYNTLGKIWVNLDEKFMCRRSSLAHTTCQEGPNSEGPQKLPQFL